MSRYEKAYQKRIKQEFISGVYIPKDLTDAFIQLNQLIDKESKVKFKAVDEKIAARKLHFSFGRWMIYNWGFYEGSRLSHFLQGLGVNHPDDMAYFLMITYHRNLNKNKLNVKELIQEIQERRLQEEAEKEKKGEILFQETRKKN